MDYTIAIPTLDRPQTLERLLGSLETQRRRYGWDIPIEVFDHSAEDSARDVVSRFSRVSYRGSSERQRFVSVLAEKTKLPESDLSIVFGRGYGGNRNYILASHPRGGVLMMDDDTLPFSYQVPDTEPTEAIAIDVPHPRGAERIPVDIPALFHPLGKDVDEIGAPQYTAMAMKRRGNTLAVTGTPTTMKGKVSFVTPHISYHGDLLVKQKGRVISAYRNMSPALFKDESLSACCLGVDVSAVEVPFPPVILPCEDYLFSKFQSRISYVPAVSIMHEREGVPSADAQDDEITATAFLSLVAYTLQHAGSAQSLPEYLPRGMTPLVMSAVRDTVGFLETRDGSVGEYDLVSGAHRLVHESFATSLALRHWPRIREAL